VTIGKTARRGAGNKLASALAGCALAMAAVSGCTSARSSLGTSDSACYLALPSATQAVESHGRLVGVHLFTLMSLRQRAPQLFKALPAQSPSRQRVCVIGFAGTFSSTSVVKPLGQSSGRLAAVVLMTPSNQLLGTVLLSHPPLPFGHPHIG
jgi:hypothetical protein